MNGTIRFEKQESGDGIIVFMHDYDTGSSTSLGARTVTDGFVEALWWLGYTVELPKEMRDA